MHAVRKNHEGLKMLQVEHEELLSETEKDGTGFAVFGTLDIGRLQEVDYKTGDVKVEIDVYNNKASAPHYQGHIIDLKQAFAK